MSTKEFMGQIVEIDEDGHFVDYKLWSKDMACEIAKEEGIDELKDGHWKVINYLRDEYSKSEVSPSLRKITKKSGVNTKEIYSLFPKKPARTVAKISGLPKPKSCI